MKLRKYFNEMVDFLISVSNSPKQHIRDEQVSNLPGEVEKERICEELSDAETGVWIVVRTGNETPAQKMNHDGREGVEEEGGELVQAVEHQAVLPDDDGEHQWSHTQDIIGL